MSSTIRPTPRPGGLEFPWMEPRDLTLDEALQLLGSSHPDASCAHSNDRYLLCDYYMGCNVAMADGSVRLISPHADREAWSTLLTIDDGVDLTESDMRRLGTVVKRWKLGGWFRLILFVLVVLSPLPRVWRNDAKRTRSW